MVSDFGRVCLWFGNDAGTRRTIKPHKGMPYRKVQMQLVGGSSAKLGVASLVLNAFVGKPRGGIEVSGAARAGAATVEIGPPIFFNMAGRNRPRG